MISLVNTDERFPSLVSALSSLSLHSGTHDQHFNDEEDLDNDDEDDDEDGDPEADDYGHADDAAGTGCSNDFRH